MQKIILALLVVNTLIVAGAVAVNVKLYQVIAQGGDGFANNLFSAVNCSGDDCDASRNPEEYLFFPVEKIIVSLPESGREHYFVLDLVLQSDTDTDKKKLQQVDPMVRNSAVAYLSSLSFSELRNTSISQLQQDLEGVILEDFKERQLATNFSHVLVSKLVVQ